MAAANVERPPEPELDLDVLPERFSETVSRIASLRELVRQLRA
jgi:hypothetical protein